MTTKQFFEMELPLNVTRNEMSEILDALFTTERIYKEAGLKYLAKNCDELYVKISDIVKKYDTYFEQ